MLPNVGRLSCRALRCKRANLARLSEDAKLSRSNPGARVGDHRRGDLHDASAFLVRGPDFPASVVIAHDLEQSGGLCIRVHQLRC